MRGLKELNIFGGDVVERGPQYDTTANTAHIAARMVLAVLCLMVSV
ncbi:arginase family protein [Rhizobium freirei]